jgi:hypothetical protein
MGPAAALAGREIPDNPETWAAYRLLVHAVIGSIAHLPVVLLGVCTPMNSTTGQSMRGRYWTALTRSERSALADTPIRSAWQTLSATDANTGSLACRQGPGKVEDRRGCPVG